MTALWARIEPLLGQVQKPARYIGCEDGAITPRHGPGKVSWLLAYPDTYEVGLPNQGLQILYEILNERDDAVAERTYAPWHDLAALLRRHGVPLFSVDTHRAAGEFDLLAFNLSSELVFTNLLDMVDLAGVPVRAGDRRPEHPLVVIGGHAAFNPEPLADFVDLVVLGRRRGGRRRDHRGRRRVDPRRARRSRDAVLRDLAQVPGVYVPSLYDVTYDGPDDRRVTPRYPTCRRPSTSAPSPISASGRTRSARSCRSPRSSTTGSASRCSAAAPRGCRFCQAGMITRPVRERPAEQVRTMVADGLRRIGLRRGQPDVAVDGRLQRHRGRRRRHPRRPRGRRSPAARRRSTCRRCASTPSPSASPGRSRAGAAAGLTFAPEAGSWRLRSVINKLITEDDLYGAVEAAFAQGWSRMKLYFLTGLPTETDDDTLGIAELARNCVALGRRHTGAGVGDGQRRRVRPQAAHAVPVVRAEHAAPSCGARSSCCARPRARPATSTSSGTTRRRPSPRASPAAATAASAGSSSGCGAPAARSRSGASTSTCDRWTDAMDAEGLSLDWYVHRHRDRATRCCRGTTSPPGCTSDFLWDDWQAALAAQRDRRTAGGRPCYDCGVCTGYGIEHVVASPVPPAGGSQGTGQDLDRGGVRSVPRAVRPPARRRSGGPMKLRVRYAKLGKVRFTSHRDTARIWERAMRKARLPVATSAGFTPRPRLSFGLALPTGAESIAEYLDIELVAGAVDRRTSTGCPTG